MALALRPWPAAIIICFSQFTTHGNYHERADVRHGNRTRLPGSLKVGSHAYSEQALNVLPARPPRRGITTLYPPISVLKFFNMYSENHMYLQCQKG